MHGGRPIVLKMGLGGGAWKRLCYAYGGCKSVVKILVAPHPFLKSTPARGETVKYYTTKAGTAPTMGPPQTRQRGVGIGSGTRTTHAWDARTSDGSEM